MNEMFILGPKKPDITQIEFMLNRANKTYIYAYAKKEGRLHRVDNDTKNQAESFDNLAIDKLVLVDCKPKDIRISGWPKKQDVVHIETKENMKPSEFFTSSVIGQIWNIIYPDYLPSEEILMSAASSYSLRAAYEGKCPGIDRDKFYEFRKKIKNINEQELMLIEALIRGILANVPENVLVLDGEVVVDLRQGIERCTKCDTIRIPNAKTHFSYKEIENDHDHKWKWFLSPLEAEVREFSCRYLIPVMFYTTFGIGEGGKRIKEIHLTGSDGRAVSHFINRWGKVNSVRDIHGDPERGFAGGYIY